MRRGPRDSGSPRPAPRAPPTHTHTPVPGFQVQIDPASLAFAMTCSAVVLALQCSTFTAVFALLAPPPPPLPRLPRPPNAPPVGTPSPEKACRMIMSFPQPSGPTRMKGSPRSIHGPIMAKARLQGAKVKVRQRAARVDRVVGAGAADGVEGRGIPVKRDRLPGLL